MNKKDLLSKITRETGCTIEMAKSILSSFQTSLLEVLQSEGEFTLFELGKFKVFTTKERSGFNPKTREKITIAAKDSVKFAPSSKLKTTVASKFSGLNSFTY